MTEINPDVGSGVMDNSDEVHVELYTNNVYPPSVNLVVAQAGEDGMPLLVGSTEATSPTIRAGRVVADVPLVEFESRTAAGTAQIRGTYRPAGGVRLVDKDFEDAGERIQVTGTNQDLRTDLRVRIGAEWVDLTCSDAFRFNLRTTRTPIV